MFLAFKISPAVPPCSTAVDNKGDYEVHKVPNARRNKCFSICHPETPNNLVYGRATIFFKMLYNSTL